MNNHDFEYFDPLDPNQYKAGKIRGPVKQWNVKGRLRVGYHSSINGRLKTRGAVKIGKYCAIGDDVRLIAVSHDPQTINLQIWLQSEIGSKKGGTSRGPIIIGNNVWIGDLVCVMSGVTVGNGAILAAGAVVTKDVEPYSIVAGVPAKHIRYRFSESVRHQLEAIKWWNWDDERIKRNIAFFDCVLEPDRDIRLESLVSG
ncbi:virginiamycin A acetyltransferase [Sinorhizobium terangae]|nr:CatB-related O-acetyltransferase [Sinorhizobium terangae]MBB4184219.1 virginiamycin A acetyltransferase [Sinorhizobium terangae]